MLTSHLGGRRGADRVGGSAATGSAAVAEPIHDHVCDQVIQVEFVQLSVALGTPRRQESPVRPGPFAMVFGMPDTYQDPSGNTEAFRAFAHPAAEPPAAPAKPSPNLPLIIGAVVAVVVVLGLIGWLALA